MFNTKPITEACRRLHGHPTRGQPMIILIYSNLELYWVPEQSPLKPHESFVRVRMVFMQLLHFVYHYHGLCTESSRLHTLHMPHHPLCTV